MATLCQSKGIVMDNDNKLPKSYYSIAEVKKILGVGKNKVYVMLNDGTIPRKRIGKVYRIPVDSFNEWAATPEPVDENKFA